MNTASPAKFNMIEQQIRPWEVLDPQVLSTLYKINREDFVIDAYKGLAYADCQIPLSHKAKMMMPTLEGRMLQALGIGAFESVLEIGSGSGYVTACIEQLAGQVEAIDIDAGLVEFTETNLAANLSKAALKNIKVSCKNAYEINQKQKFDVIAVSASVSEVPQNLSNALKIGGRMFIIVGTEPVMQAMLITRFSESQWHSQSLFETSIAALIK